MTRSAYRAVALGAMLGAVVPGCGGASTTSPGSEEAKRSVPSPAEARPSACRLDRARELAAEIEVSEPHAWPELVAGSFGKVCETPGFLRFLFVSTGPADLHALERATGLSFKETREENNALWTRLCPGAEEVFTKAWRAGFRRRSQIVYDGCKLERFGVVEREAWNSQRLVREAFAAHQWLLEQGVPGRDARWLSRAVLAFERRQERSAAEEDLPRVDAVLLRPGYTASVMVTPTEILGVRATPYLVHSTVDSAISGQFAERVGDLLDEQKARRPEVPSDPLEVGVAIYARPDVAWSRIVELLDVIGARGMTPVGLMAETGPYEYGLIRVEPSLDKGFLPHSDASHGEVVEQLVSRHIIGCADPSRCRSEIIVVQSRS